MSLEILEEHSASIIRNEEQDKQEYSMKQVAKRDSIACFLLHAGLLLGLFFGREFGDTSSEISVDFPWLHVVVSQIVNGV
jgi:hypothetical protein